MSEKKDDKRQDGKTLTLVPSDGSEGAIVIELPMSLDWVSKTLTPLAAVGWEFEHIVKARGSRWPPDVSLTYACPHCGDEVDIRNAKPL